LATTYSTDLEVIDDPVPADANMFSFPRAWMTIATLKGVTYQALFRRDPYLAGALQQLHASCCLETGCGLPDSDDELRYAAGFSQDPDLWESIRIELRRYLVRGRTSGLVYVRMFAADLAAAWKVKWKGILQTAEMRKAARDQRERARQAAREMQQSTGPQTGIGTTSPESAAAPQEQTEV
jgi:hypothetical protein